VHTEWGDLIESDDLGDLGVNGRVILKCIFNRWNGGVDWIDLAQDTDRFPAFVNAVMNLQLP